MNRRDFIKGGVILTLIATFGLGKIAVTPERKRSWESVATIRSWGGNRDALKLIELDPNTDDIELIVVMDRDANGERTPS